MPRVSKHLCYPMTDEQKKRYHGEMMLMFELLPKVSADFGITPPSIDFQFTGKRNGTYHWATKTISMSPKVWHGSPIHTFIHEFAHHVQNMAGRSSREFILSNLEYDASGGHGWSFYEILVVVSEHFEFIYGIPYDWTIEYDHIKVFHQIMGQSPDYISERQLSATVSLFGCSRDEARRIILSTRMKESADALIA